MTGKKSRARGNKVLESSGFPCVLSLVCAPLCCFGATAPNLSPGFQVVVEQNHASAVSGCSSGSGDAGWSGAYDDNIRVLHRSDSTTMPSQQIS